MRRTKRVPQDEGKLWDLLALFAELQQGSLARVLVEQVGDVGHGAAVVLGYVVVAAILGMGGEVVGVGMGAGDAVVVLLLGDRGGGGSGLLLGMLVVRGLLVHPRRVGLRVELVMSVDVRRGHHLGRPMQVKPYSDGGDVGGERARKAEREEAEESRSRPGGRGERS